MLFTPLRAYPVGSNLCILINHLKNFSSQNLLLKYIYRIKWGEPNLLFQDLTKVKKEWDEL